MTIPFWTLDGTIDLTELQPEHVSAGVLADTLAKVNRFGGRTREPWSVAAHSVLVEQLCPPDLRPWALLHDGHEAFLGDLTEPALEYMCRCGTRTAVMHAVGNAKTRIDRVIGAAWGVVVRSENLELRQADRTALIAEAWVFMGIRPEIDRRADLEEIDRAMTILSEMPHSHHWQVARDLWLSRAEHYAGLGLLRQPAPIPPSSAGLAG